MGQRPFIYPHTNLWKNLKEVQRLLEVHTKMSGSDRGYKHNVEVLNKSAIVLLTACWEAFVEDMAETAFSILLERAKDHTTFANAVLSGAGKPLKDSNDLRAIWRLAGDGWKNVLKKHESTLFKKYIGKLNTPRPEQVDALYKSLLGIKSLSSHWHWHGMSSANAKSKLSDFVALRGSIAHRVAASKSVLKNDVRDYGDFINRIAVQTSNTVRKLILDKTGKSPWPYFMYKRVSKS